MSRRKPNRLGYAVVAATCCAVIAAVGTFLFELSALGRFTFWGLLVPLIVIVDGVIDGTRSFLIGVRPEFYLVFVLAVAAAFLVFLVEILPGMVESDSQE